MVDATHTSYPAGDRSYFSLLKKEIHQKAASTGLTETRLAELDIVLAEITSNLHKYATDGEILLALGHDAGGKYIEIIAIDNGPGMADPAKMMQDGYTTSTSMGHGLGSIKRLSDVFDLYSIKGWGTIILSRIYLVQPASQPVTSSAVNITTFVVAKTGETVSGDGVYMQQIDNKIYLLVADGLGHGKEANLAVNEAVKYFQSTTSASPVEYLRHMHHNIRRTRGMVGAVSILDLPNKQLQIAGIGNISVRLLNPNGEIKNHISYNGIIGHNIPTTMNSQQYSFTDYNMVLFCSDGIKSRLDLSKYPGIAKCDAAILAAAIYKDHSRRTDDTTVVVVKHK